ncbi:hypothetical protein K438DRAFT_1788225 [Mycena galopus ATCC 62051]|nr:hypothetical protein K438DRAFT_1788225 [Mycena galopus ATCC 62051]
MAAAERRGLQAIRNARARVGPLLPIADDNWEDGDVDEEPDAEEETPELHHEAPTPSHPPLPSDIYRVPSRPASMLPTPEQLHSNPAAYILYLLVVWLHTVLHLPFRGCDAILLVVGYLLQAAGTPVPHMLTTLPSVMNHLGVEPAFQTLPLCPNCCEVFPSSTSPSTKCLRCSIPIFRITGPSPLSRTPQMPKPCLQFPTKSIEEQLKDMLAVPGIEEEMDWWRTKGRTEGVLEDFFNGRISKEIEGPDGLPFFRPGDSTGSGPDNELRVGLTLGVDWFSYLRSQMAPSHTSGPISFNVINFGHFFGPKEQDPDQVQRIMRVIVDELLRLWRDGVWVQTPNHPLGRLKRIILVGVICDKPAAHKMGGFGSHSHQFFCTRCWIRQQDKATKAAFEKNGNDHNIFHSQILLMEEYLKCSSAAARKAFVKEHAARFCELSRLPYFNLCTMIIIDPMHNLLLGLVKTHFYNIWVLNKVLRKTKEMRRFHALLADMVAAVIVCPILIPQIWSEYMPSDVEAVQNHRINMLKLSIAEKKNAAAEARKAKAEAQKQATAAQAPAQMPIARPKRNRRPTERAAQMDVDPDQSGADAGAMEEDDDDKYQEIPGGPRKRGRTRRDDEDDEEEEEREGRTPSNLHPDDPSNFCKLSSAIKLLLAHPITHAQIDESERLLRSYLPELITLYGEDVIKPNHHYATHTAEDVRNYGPLQEFWTFLFERINKVLKSYNSSNHSGGELETSFFREFHRTVQTSRILAQAATFPVHQETVNCLVAYSQCYLLPVALVAVHRLTGSVW